MAEPQPVFVVAIGNPLRGDDGVAWRVVEALRTEAPPADAPELRFETVHQLVPELAEPLSRARGVVFIDARTDDAPGTVSHERVVPGGGDAPVTHALTPATLLLYAERLFGRAPPATLVGVGAARFDHGEELSPPVEAALPKAVRLTRRLARTLAPASRCCGRTPS